MGTNNGNRCFMDVTKRVSSGGCNENVIHMKQFFQEKDTFS